MAKNVLKGRLMDNSVTVDDKTDKILKLDITRSVDEAYLLDLMVKKNPGIRREIMQTSISLFQEAIAEEVCNGNSVNISLCRFVAQFTGVIRNNAWDKTRNSIYVSIQQGRRLAQEIANTVVKIMPETASAYISSGEDASTRAQDFSATAGRNYTLTGRNIKVTGDDPSVGITLTDSKGKVTRLASDMIAVNSPSKVVVLLPDVADDEYTLTITTQYGTGKHLATPRAITQTLYVGKAPSGGGGGGDDNDPGIWG
ncbi:MAG: DUF4469 domain-containing protein [Prevotellaceae bacterium]|jgi:hypothetical protein|nr:DUF4469 domain-containing protein [Prevotellaceae bacterium]